jgi:antitoxin VapB
MITIDDPETERLARELAARRGESVEAVVRAAVLAQAATVEELAQAEAAPAEQARRKIVIERIQREIAALPVLDTRSADEILGYDENGLPT